MIRNVLFYARIGVALCIVAMVVYGCTTYGSLVLPSDNDTLYPFVPPGKRVLIHRRYRDLQRGHRVFFQGSHNAEFLTGVVRALPGDTVYWQDSALILPEGVLAPCTASQSRVWMPMAAGSGYTLKDGEYLILNENMASLAKDGRDFGVINRSKIFYRIIIAVPF